MPVPEPEADGPPVGLPVGPSAGLPVGSGRRRAAIVLAGGEARRWGGRDKTAADLAGRPVLAHVVQGLPAGLPVVVVGPPDHPFARTADPTRVRWTREEPPGGGPVAGLAAGLAALPGGVDEVAVLAGDLPDGGTALPRLFAVLTCDDVDAAVGLDPDGRRQPLLAAYRVPALRAALHDGAAAGRPMRSVLALLRTRDVAVTAAESFDLDTPAELDALRTRRGEQLGIQQGEQQGEQEHPAVPPPPRPPS